MGSLLLLPDKLALNLKFFSGLFLVMTSVGPRTNFSFPICAEI